MTRDNPGVIAPPPLIYAAALILGWLLNRLLPIAILPDWIRIVGIALIVLSLIPGPWALVSMILRGTNPEPSHPTTALVTTGIFRFTRNPIYLSFTLFSFGVALLTQNLWMLIMTAAAIGVLHYGVILREERYLERKFGDDYRAYKARVRRWL